MKTDSRPAAGSRSKSAASWPEDSFARQGGARIPGGDESEQPAARREVTSSWPLLDQKVGFQGSGQQGNSNYGSTWDEHKEVFDTAAHARDAQPEEERSRFFPMHPFWFLGPLEKFIPTTCRRIVSVPHLVLAVGIVACTTMTANTLYSWWNFGCRTTYCQQRLLPLVFVGFCVMYFCSTIQQYDEALVIKQRQLQKAKKECQNQYMETVSEMEGLLGRAVDNQVVLAERSFESQRRDFSRFLKRYERDVSKEVGDDEGLPPFRGLVVQWLLVFAECSVDPMHHPLKVLEADELDDCKTAAEVAATVDERVQHAEVKFITSQKEQDQKELTTERSLFKSVVKLQKKDLRRRQSVCGSIPAFHSLDIEDGLGSRSITFTPADEDTPEEYSWVHLGRFKPYGVSADSETGSFPYEISLPFVTIILLSYDHLRLILGFLAGIPVMLFEILQLQTTFWRLREDTHYAASVADEALNVIRIADDIGLNLKSLRRVNWLLLVQVAICLVCIAFVLHQFLDMDIVQQLEGQLRELEAKKKQVDEKRERINNFFEAIQQLADAWTHRTVTRLELLKHLQEKLMDERPSQHARLLASINERVETLEGSIPAMEQWRSEEHISAKKKKLFGAAMAELYQDRGNLEATLSFMDKANFQIQATFSDAPLNLGNAQMPPDIEATIAASGGDPAAEPATLSSSASRLSGLSGLKVLSSSVEDSFKPGDEAQYLSSSQGRWVPATILRRNPINGLYDLDCKDQVPPERIRAVAATSGCAQQ